MRSPGAYAATIGTTIGLISVALDGVDAQAAGRHMAVAPAAEQAVTLAMV